MVIDKGIPIESLLVCWFCVCVEVALYSPTAVVSDIGFGARLAASVLRYETMTLMFTDD